MRVLVACEYSGAVRDAFTAAGHYALSCDLLPTDAPGNHYQGDVLDIVDQDWDLLVAHPPCTYLTKSGIRWLHDEDHQLVLPGLPPTVTRWELMIDGAVFFRKLLDLPIPRIAVENPRMHRFAAKIVGCAPDQIVQPWMFGHPESKATGLWLKNLPPLAPTEDVKLAMGELPKAEQQRLYYLPPSDDRWKVRSATFPGLAAAMANQWGVQ